MGVRAALLSGLYFAAALPAAAGPARAPDDADWRETKRTIADMRTEARERRSVTARAYEQAVEDCNRKVFNSDCLAGAKRDRDRANREAADLERGALAIEKSLKSETRAIKQATEAQRAEMRSSPDAKRAAQERNRAEKQAVKAEKDALRDSSGAKREIESRNRVEKLELKLEKLKPGHAPVE